MKTSRPSTRRWLGCLIALTHVFTQLPHSASFVAQKHQSPVPPELGWFLKKGMQKDPRDRYQSVQQLLDRLELRAQGIFPIQCHLTFVKRMNMAFTRFSDRHPMFVTGLVFLGVPLAIGASIWSIVA